MSIRNTTMASAMSSAIPAIRRGLALAMLVGLGAFAARVEVQPSPATGSEIRARGDAP